MGDLDPHNRAAGTYLLGQQTHRGDDRYWNTGSFDFSGKHSTAARTGASG